MWSVVSSCRHFRLPSFKGLQGALYFHVSLKAIRSRLLSATRLLHPAGCCDFALWSSPSTSFPMDFLPFTGTGEDLTLTGLAKLLKFLGDWGVIRQHQGHSGTEKVRSGTVGEWKSTRSVTSRGCQEAETLQTPSLQIALIFVACSISPV